MNHSTLNAQFLTSLTPRQRGLLWEYYRLTTSSLASCEGEIDHLSRIWEEAKEDTTLCEWLRLIDYFYTNVPFSYESDDDDRRAFLSEHIELLVGEPRETSTAHLSTSTSAVKDKSDADSPNGFCTLMCPDGSGYLQRPVEEMSLINSAEWKNQQCGNCHQKFGEHWINRSEASSIG